MATQNTKYQAHQQGSPLTSKKTSKPIPTSPDEVVIRLKAAAINPADCKMIDQGLRVASWPLVPGLDGAGVVDAVGEGVSRFNVGDAVLASFASGDRGASFQEFAVVKENMAAKMSVGWSFDEAASLGVCFLTAVTALGIGLKTPLPFLNDGTTTGSNPSSVLVLGGSSALGAAVIKLLRLVLPECRVLVTSSPKHHDHLTTTLGATAAFDRDSSELVQEVKAATPGHCGVEAIIDAVGAGRAHRHIFDTFTPDGPKRYAQVWTGEDKVEVPGGTNSVMFSGADLVKLPGATNVMLALETILRETKYRLPLPVRNVGQGLEGLRNGLDLMRMGVSGEKLVVTL